MPAHVQRISFDEEGQRITQIIAVCDSTDLNNNVMVYQIVQGLQLLQVLKQNSQLFESNMSLYRTLNRILEFNNA